MNEQEKEEEIIDLAMAPPFLEDLFYASLLFIEMRIKSFLKKREEDGE